MKREGKLNTIRWRGFDNKSLGPLSVATELENASIAILPIGATEQHGGLLPVGMDSIVATELAVAVAERLDAYRLPTIPIGTSIEHRGSFGTAWLRPTTLRLVVRDIAESISQWGVSSLALITGHGGNLILGPTVRELNLDFPSLRTVLVPERVQHGPDRDPNELHVGMEEMSIGCSLMSLDPPNEDSDFVPDAHRDELDTIPLLELSETGVWGHPSRANAQIGVTTLAARIDRISSYLHDILHR